jgi:hypothetical protein
MMIRRTESAAFCQWLRCRTLLSRVQAQRHAELSIKRWLMTRWVGRVRLQVSLDHSAQMRHETMMLSPALESRLQQIIMQPALNDANKPSPSPKRPTSLLYSGPGARSSVRLSAGSEPYLNSSALGRSSLVFAGVDLDRRGVASFSSPMSQSFISAQPR